MDDNKRGDYSSFVMWCHNHLPSNCKFGNSFTKSSFQYNIIIWRNTPRQPPSLHQTRRSYSDYKISILNHRISSHILHACNKGFWTRSLLSSVYFFIGVTYTVVGWKCLQNMIFFIKWIFQDRGLGLYKTFRLLATSASVSISVQLISCTHTQIQGTSSSGFECCVSLPF